MTRSPPLLMSEDHTITLARITLLATLLANAPACGSSSSPPADAGPPDAGPDAATDTQLRDDFCGYWPLDPGPSCGEEIFGSVEACLEAIAGCEDRELLGIGFCWEGADERCDPSCLPTCAERP
jgi:hypothetical protein